MIRPGYILFVCLLLASVLLRANGCFVIQVSNGVAFQLSVAEAFSKDTLAVSPGSDTLCFQVDQSTESSCSLVPMDRSNKKKWIAAICAFPFPFGFVGLHRIMLGTKPWVPIVYVATFGGCFGLLPLIDFCVILCSKDTEQYENNPNVFMWIK